MPTPSWSKADSKIYDQKDFLFRMMDKAKTFKRHLKHKALYDALAASLIVDEDDMDIVFGKSHPRNNYDKDHPPAADSKKKRRRDDTDNDLFASVDKDQNKKQKKLDSSKNEKDQVDTSKQEKSSSKPSQSTQTVDADEGIFDIETNAEDIADIEGLVYQLLKGTCQSCIELEYHLEQRYLTFSEQMDWINPEGDNTPKVFNNPLPLVGTPNCFYIQASHFFNKDLEYLEPGTWKRRNTQLQLQRQELLDMSCMELKKWLKTYGANPL
ncbi:hypothetical protein Tco_1075180 [Tanacetum coccineum]